MNEVLAHWTTPRGKPVSFWLRPGTNDWNTLNSICAADEYGLADLHLSGWALDVGAYLGGVAICLALDNPDLHVEAIEPVPDNARLIRRNIAENGLDRQVTLIEGACGKGGEPVEVWFNYRGTETAEHHANVGNSSLAYDDGGMLPHDSKSYAAIGLHSWTPPLEFVKIDCEGCEYAFLDNPAVSRVKEIRGEFHPVRGKTRADIEALLSPTHVVTFPPVPEGVDPILGPGPFVAVRR